jgi:DNA-binding NtrC family response regulator
VGEPGTGRQAFAQAIHQASDRRDRAFVAVNCATLPREQAQRELLGSTNGPGRLEAADVGTLFLDEIGELPPAAQAVLLRAMEEGEITRVGEVRSRSVCLRVIGATSRALPALLANGRLRPELVHRLNVMSIELPALRERGRDLQLLARRFFQSVARDLGRPEVVVEERVFTAFEAYGWPGNLRELKSVVRRLMVAAGTRITLADLPQAIRAAALGHAPAAPADAGLLRTQPGQASHIDEEDARLMEVVNRSRTMAEAAAELGITRSTLYRRMERFGLKPRRVVDRG